MNWGKVIIKKVTINFSMISYVLEPMNSEETLHFDKDNQISNQAD